VLCFVGRLGMIAPLPPADRHEGRGTRMRMPQIPLDFAPR
jgi:hypothetical protein